MGLSIYHKTLWERAWELSQGIIIIRFDMPYNTWCEGCENHPGMAAFRIKCHLCVNNIEMQADAATCDYALVRRAPRKKLRWDVAHNKQILTKGLTEKEKLETDAMYKLDCAERDKEKLEKALSQILEYRSIFKDDYQLSSALRRKFREEKKRRAVQEKKDNPVRIMRANISIPLLPENEEDRKLAALLTYQTLDSCEKVQQNKREEIASRSWSNSTPKPAPSPAGRLLQKLALQAKQAAVAKALASRPNILIRKRTSGSGIKTEQCATITHRQSHPDVSKSLVPDYSDSDSEPEMMENQRKSSGGVTSLVSDLESL